LLLLLRYYSQGPTGCNCNDKQQRPHLPQIQIQHPQTQRGECQVKTSQPDQRWIRQELSLTTHYCEHLVTSRLQPPRSVESREYGTCAAGPGNKNEEEEEEDDDDGTA